MEKLWAKTSVFEPLLPEIVTGNDDMTGTFVHLYRIHLLHEIPHLSIQTYFRTSFYHFFTGMNFLGGCFLWGQNWAKTTIRGYFGTFRNVLPEKNIPNSIILVER